MKVHCTVLPGGLNQEMQLAGAMHPVQCNGVCIDASGVGNRIQLSDNVALKVCSGLKMLAGGVCSVHMLLVYWA